MTAAPVKRPRRAYAVLEDSESTGGIVFARSNVEARRIGAAIYHDGEFSGRHCNRVPWADAYEPEGNVPASVCIDNGWHFECCGCGANIDSDWLYDNDLTIEGVIDRLPSYI